MQKSFRCTTCIFSLIPCPPFLCPLLPSLSNVLCPLSHVVVLCLPLYVPCLMSLFLVSRPLSPVSWLCSLSPVLCLMALFLVSRPLSHDSVPCLPSSVSWLCSLSPVLCPLSHGSAPCLPSPVSGPVLTALILVLRPLSPVYQLSQCPFFVALFHCSCPLLLCYPSSVSPSLVLCPLSFILARLRDFLKKYTVELSRLRRWIFPLRRRVYPSVVESPPPWTSLRLCRRVSCHASIYCCKGIYSLYNTKQWEMSEILIIDGYICRTMRTDPDAGIQGVSLSTTSSMDGWTCRVYPFPPPAVWTCRVYPFSPGAIWTCRFAGCIYFHH